MSQCANQSTNQNALPARSRREVRDADNQKH